MMARTLSWLCLSLLAVALSAIVLPRLYHLAFAPDVEPTHMFYSPVKRDFVFREHRGDHDFTYASAGGETFDRRDFEKTLPFIYYRNMDLWGLLPITVDGQTFDREAIRDARQVFELKAFEIADRHPSVPVFALLDSDPGQAGLSFPEDVFRMTRDAMEFVNVDINRVDPDLTERFTTALRDQDFAFPARLVAGKQTILKPFDEGVFIVDAAGAVFHVKRTGDTPVVRRTPIPTDLGIRSIKVTENERRVFLALMLTGDGRLFLLRSGSYDLVPLPVEGYDPDSMDYKLLVNPIAPTAVYGNDRIVRAVAMTPDLTPFASYDRDVPGTTGMAHDLVAKALFPFTLSLDDGAGGYLRWSLQGGNWTALFGNLLATIGVLLLGRLTGRSARETAGSVLLTLATGIFGLVAALLVPAPRHPAADNREAGRTPALAAQQ